MRILVTGGAGFIGSHLVDRLVEQGHQVRVLDSFEEQVHRGQKPTYLNTQAEYIAGYVQDRALLVRTLRDMEVVFHEAAAVGVGQSMYQIQHYVEANTLATAVLLDVIVNEYRSLRKLIVASSMSIYGEGLYTCGSCGDVAPGVRAEAQLKQRDWDMRCPRCQAVVRLAGTPETKAPAPTSIYASTKYDQEEMCLQVGRAYSIPTTALRYFNVYGTRQSLSNPYTGVCAIFSSRIKNNNPPLIYEDGRQARDFIHVSDIVRANVLAMEHPATNYEMFNVGTGQPTSVQQIAQLLIQLYGVEVQPDIVEQFRTGDIRHCIGDIGKLQSLGFQTTVALQDGLRELVAWGREAVSEDRVAEAAQELAARGLTHD